MKIEMDCGDRKETVALNINGLCFMRWVIVYCCVNNRNNNV